MSSTVPDQPAVETFLRLTKELQAVYPIHRAVLIIKEPAFSRFIAAATLSESRERRNLNLRLPGHTSLFEKVAEHGQIFTDSYFDLFSGNRFERNLLLDEDSRSYALIPLKQDGEVVGLVGFSSPEPQTFATFESGAIDEEIHTLEKSLGTTSASVTG